MPCIFPQLYTSEKQKLTKRRKQPFLKQALHIYSLAHSTPQTLSPTAHFARLIEIITNTFHLQIAHKSGVLCKIWTIFKEKFCHINQ